MAMDHDKIFFSENNMRENAFRLVEYWLCVEVDVSEGGVLYAGQTSSDVCLRLPLRLFIACLTNLPRR